MNEETLYQMIADALRQNTQPHQARALPSHVKEQQARALARSLATSFRTMRNRPAKATPIRRPVATHSSAVASKYD